MPDEAKVEPWMIEARKLIRGRIARIVMGVVTETPDPLPDEELDRIIAEAYRSRESANQTANEQMLEALRKYALRKYGKHTIDCLKECDDPNCGCATVECTCGFESAIAFAEKET